MPTLLGRPRFAVGLAVAAFAFAPVFSVSSANELAAPSYESLLARLEEMPSAIEADALAEAADARAQQARAFSNPSLAFDAENAFGSGPYSGLGNAETTLSVSQPLELFGQRSARIAAAQADSDAVKLTSEQMRLEFAARLALVYADAEAAARRFESAKEALSLTEQDASAVKRLVEEGREAALRGLQADSEVAAARASLDAAQALRDGAFARLSSIALLETPVQEITDSLLERVPGDASPSTAAPLSVQIAEAQYNAAGRRITVEQRRARPDITASVGMRRFRESSDDAFAVGLSVSIPLFDRNRGGIRAAYADERAAEARLFAEQQRAQADRLAAEAALLASGSRTRAADAGLASAEEAYRLSRVGVDAGRVSQLELRASRSALIAARNSVVDARLGRVLAEVDLARLDGRAPFEEIR